MNEDLEQRIKKSVRNVPDFPKKGIQFKDITTLLMDPDLCNAVIDEMVDRVRALGLTKVVGIESRGFLFGQALAMRLDLPFILVRKAGKLPYEKITTSYNLEYGEATMEMHQDAIVSNDVVLIHDDLLATGGTAKAAADLVTSSGGRVAGYLFLIHLSYLNGQRELRSENENIINLATY
ncbi:MAG: adenine phosphoribosyltransferase [Bacteroidota bacterium]